MATGSDQDESHQVDVETSHDGQVVYTAEAFDGDVEAGDQDVRNPATGPWEGLEIRVTARDAATGDVRWVASIDAPMGPSWPVGLALSPGGERIYVAGPVWADILAFGNAAFHDYLTIAIDADTGELIWERTADGPRDPQQPSVPSDDLPSDIAVGPDDTVYVTGEADAPPTLSGQHQTVAYDGATGDELWRHHQAGEAGAREVAVAPNGGTVFVLGDVPTNSGIGGTVTYALDADTGTELWEAGLPGDRTGEGLDLTVSSQGVYIYGGVNGNSDLHDTREFVIRYDPATGQTTWYRTWELGRAEPDNFHHARDLLAVDEASDRLYLAAPLPEDAATTVHGYIYDLDLTALEASTGEPVWTVNFGRPTTDLLYLGLDVVEIQLSPDGDTVYGVAQPWHRPGIRTAAHDASTGEHLWSATYQDASQDAWASALAVGPGDDQVYVLGELREPAGEVRSVTLAYDASGPTVLEEGPV